MLVPVSNLTIECQRGIIVPHRGKVPDNIRDTGYEPNNCYLDNSYILYIEIKLVLIGV